MQRKAPKRRRGIEKVVEAVRADRPLAHYTPSHSERRGACSMRPDVGMEAVYEWAEGAKVTIYEIRVKGHLDERWSDWFDGLEISNLKNGEALLSGEIVDQAALHGVLAKVRDLNLALVAVSSVGPERQDQAVRPARY